MDAVSTSESDVVQVPKSFYGWLAGSLLSELGDAALYFGTGWAATAYGGGWAGIIVSAKVVPRILFMLIGGVLSDRRSARTVLLISSVVMFVTCGLFAATVARSGPSVWLLLVFGILIGTTDAFFLPAANSMPRLLVGANLLPRAMAMNQAGGQVVTMVGAPLGGVLVASAGLSGTAVIDALTFVGVFLVVLRLRASPGLRGPSPRRGIVAEAGDGVRFAMGHPLLRPGICLTAIVAGAAIPVPLLLIPLLARTEGFSASATGLMVGAQGIGVVVIAVCVAGRGAFRRPGVIAALALVLMGAAFGGFVLGVSLAVLIVAAFGAGVGQGLFMTHVGPLLLRTSPDEQISRIQALLGLMQGLALLVFSNVLGGVAQSLGVRSAFAVCGVAVLVAAVFAATSGVIRRSSFVQTQAA